MSISAPRFSVSAFARHYSTPSKRKLNNPIDFNASSYLHKTPKAACTALSLQPQKTAPMNLHQSLNSSLTHLLQAHPKSCLFGEDVSFGGVFRVTTNLLSTFGPNRVFNTPLTEAGIVGLAIGLSSNGYLALPEIQFADYMFPAFDQLHSEASTWRYRSGGAPRFNAGGMVVRMPTGAVGHGALYHSQSPEGFLACLQGVRTIIPRSPAQAKGLLIAAASSGDPTCFLEPKILYRAAVEEVPVDGYEIPLDKAEIVQSGKDVTLVTYGTMVYTAELAAKAIAEQTGATVEVIDLRTIHPWDKETVMASVSKTGRLVVIHEASRTGGVGEGVAAEVLERCFLRLEAPAKRVTGWDTHMPLVFEKFLVPDVVRVFDAVKETLEY